MRRDDRPPGLGWIERMAILVPAERRDAWRREWAAEVAYAWRRMEEAGPATALDRLRLRLRVLGSTIDALDEGGRGMMTSGWGNDVRFAVRGLMRSPGFTAVALATLALGIGANTAVFSLVDGVVLRPLPFAEADRLVDLGHAGEDGGRMGMSQGLHLAYQEHAASLDGVALYGTTAANLTAGGEPERVAGAVVTPGFFEVLRVAPAVGRTFVEDEGRPGADPAVILADALWRTGFGADPAIVGATVVMDGVSRHVVGVMPPGFSWPAPDTRFWLPMAVDPALAPMGNFAYDALGRLDDGASVEAAQAEAVALLARVPDMRPGQAEFLRDGRVTPSVMTLKDAVVGDVRRTMWVLAGTVGFVLLIACANVANLLLVRAEGRSRELAVRLALGAGRLQVGRTLMAEALLLAAGGAALGLVVAQGAVAWAVRNAPAGLPRVAEVGVDARALGVAVLLAGGSALLFGLAPLARLGSASPALRLRSGGARGGTGGPEGQRLRSALVVAQVSLAVVLLVGAGLMVRSMVALRDVDPGFDAPGVLAARLTVPSGEIADARATAEFQRQLVARVAELPGVEAAGLVSGVPLTGGAFFNVELEDHPRGEGEMPIMAHVRWASPGYFEAMGIGIVDGRAFQEGDDATGLRGVVVSRAFAQRWWPDVSPLGRRVRAGVDGGEWSQVVGVTDDVRLRRLEDRAEEAVYFPTLFGPSTGPVAMRSTDLVVRTGEDPLALVPRLRETSRALSASIPLANPRSMERVLADATARASFTTTVLAGASAVALLLGMVGIYGVVSYVVSQRTREIGVRLALGARADAVRGMVVRQGLAVVAVGVAVGLPAAVALSSSLESLLFGVEATNALTYVGVTAALMAAAWLACWIPAARAARVHPTRALRAE